MWILGRGRDELTTVGVWDGELYREVFPFEGMGGWDIDVYVALARAVDGPVLELGCGTGRLLAELRSAGIDADGLELDASMRAVAVQRLAERGDTDAEARVIPGDMRTFASARRYRLVLVPDNTISTLHDDADVLATLQRVRVCLLDDGELALDQTLLSRAPSPQQWPVRDVLVAGQRMRVDIRGRYDAARSTYAVSIVATSDSAPTRRMDLSLKQRTPDELLRLLDQGGFAPIAPPVDEAGRPVDERSHLLIGRFGPRTASSSAAAR